MQALNFPAYDFRFQKKNDRSFIFDIVRKKFVSLTPEEWVRQHLITYLINEKKFPASLMGVEKELKYHRLTRRYDLIVYNTSCTPRLIAECKAPEVMLSNDTLQQIALYNSVFSVEYLLITNGISHYCFAFNKTLNEYRLFHEIPDFSLLK